MQIRLSATDGATRLYYIDVTCLVGDSDNDLLGLTVKGIDVPVPTNHETVMAPTFEEIGYPFGVFDITATIPATATVAYSDGVDGVGRTVSTQLSIAEEKTIYITVTAENGNVKAYTLKLLMTQTVLLGSFTAKFNAYNAPPAVRSGDTYTVTVPSFADYVAVTSATGIGVTDTMPTVQIGDPVSNWSDQSEKTITITVIPEGWQCDITGTNTYYAGGGGGGTGGIEAVGQAASGSGSIGQGGKGSGGTTSGYGSTKGAAGAVIVRFPWAN